VTKERRLGRGLEALLGRPLPGPGETPDARWDVPAQAAAGGAAGPTDAGGLLRLNVYEIENNPFQPRRDFDEAAIGELAESIKTHGLLQPLVVRRHGDRWQLVAGERRLRAAIKAGWADVPVTVHDADDRQMAEMAMVENLQRKDLNPLEKAASFEAYLDEYCCTQEELAGRLKIDRSTIANLIRLLELPTGVQDAVRSGAISQGHARALLPLGDDERQLQLCQRIQDESLSVRSIEELVQDTIDAEDAPKPGQAATAPKRSKTSRARTRGGHNAVLEQELRTALGTKVEVRSTAAGRGKIVVHFANAAEFERLCEHLTVQQKRSRAA
jgi:ParB family transcriptional regulator, chromosome partitioning protein